MIFGLAQEGGSLIALMALAHPLRPIHSRSRNKRRNLWVGRCVSSWWPWFPSRSWVNDIYICIPYMGSVTGRVYIYIYIYIYIQRECHSILAKLHPITFYRIVFLGSARFLGWMPLFVFFGLPIVSCSLLFNISLILGCLWPLLFVLKNTLILGIWCSTIPHLPRCFLSLDLLWEYRIHYGANGSLYVTSSYSTWIYCRGFQALQLIVLAAFGVMG